MDHQERQEYLQILEARTRTRVVQEPFPRLTRWARSLGWNELLKVPYAPEPEMVHGHCFQNVDRKVITEGGTALYGRMFIHTPDQAIQTESHAVWMDSAGQVFDITPTADTTHEPGHILFAPDPSVDELRGGSPEFHLLLSLKPRVKRLFAFEQALADLLATGFVSIVPVPVFDFPRLDRIISESGLPEEVMEDFLGKFVIKLSRAPGLDFPERYRKYLG